MSDLDVDTIERCCSPAPYGDLLNQSTQVNPDVRKALEARFVVEKADVIKSKHDDWDSRRSYDVRSRLIILYCMITRWKLSDVLDNAVWLTLKSGQYE